MKLYIDTDSLGTDGDAVAKHMEAYLTEAGHEVTALNEDQNAETVTDRLTRLGIAPATEKRLETLEKVNPVAGDAEFSALATALRVGPGKWEVGGHDGFARKKSDSWVVVHVILNDGSVWTVAS